MSWLMRKPDWWGDEPFTDQGGRDRLRRLAEPFDAEPDVHEDAMAAYGKLALAEPWEDLEQWVRDAWVIEVTDRDKATTSRASGERDDA